MYKILLYICDPVRPRDANRNIPALNHSSLDHGLGGSVLLLVDALALTLNPSSSSAPPLFSSHEQHVEMMRIAMTTLFLIFMRDERCNLEGLSSEVISLHRQSKAREWGGRVKGVR
jgi:hypothetical protein